MLESVRDSLANGLNGANSHIAPLKAISGIDSCLARKKLEPYPHNIWELLHHIVVWQDVLIKNLKGYNPDWKGVQNWPTEESMQVEENFYDLLERYKEGLKELDALTKTVDLTRPMSEEYEDPIIHLVIVAITHNSYHLGQIMLLKKSLQ